MVEEEQRLSESRNTASVSAGSGLGTWVLELPDEEADAAMRPSMGEVEVK